MRKCPYSGETVPATLGEYRDMCLVIGGPTCKAIQWLDQRIAEQGRDQEVVTPDAQNACASYAHAFGDCVVHCPQCGALTSTRFLFTSAYEWCPNCDKEDTKASDPVLPTAPFQYREDQHELWQVVYFPDSFSETVQFNEWFKDCFGHQSFQVGDYLPFMSHMRIEQVYSNGIIVAWHRNTILRWFLTLLPEPNRPGRLVVTLGEINWPQVKQAPQ